MGKCKYFCVKGVFFLILTVNLCKAESDEAITVDLGRSFEASLLLQCHVPWIDPHSSSKHSAWTRSPVLLTSSLEPSCADVWVRKVTDVWPKKQEPEESNVHLLPLPWLYIMMLLDPSVLLWYMKVSFDQGFVCVCYVNICIMNFPTALQTQAQADCVTTCAQSCLTSFEPHGL